MKKRFSDEQIISILREAEAGVNRLPEPVIRVKQPVLARFSPDIAPLFVHFRADDDVTARLYANRLPEPVIRVKQPALARFSPDIAPLFVHFRADDDVTARLYAFSG